MYYTGLDPYTMQEVYCTKNPHEKALQRALLQYYIPENEKLVTEALRRAKRYDLIGSGEKCLIKGAPQKNNNNSSARRKPQRKGKGKRYEKR